MTEEQLTYFVFSKPAIASLRKFYRNVHINTCFYIRLKAQNYDFF